MKTARIALVLSTAIVLPAAATPAANTPSNAILVWNAAVGDSLREISATTSSHLQVRVYAMTHLAMADAIHIAGREARRESANAIAEVAATAAAHDILVAFMPANVAKFSPQAATGPAILGDAELALGRRIGQQSAGSLLRRRHDDGWPVTRAQAVSARADDILRPVATLPPRGRSSERSGAPVPFALKRASQFEPEPLYHAYSDGAVLPNTRLRIRGFTPAPDPTGLPTSCREWRSNPVERWNRIAHTLANRNELGLPRSARLFALLNTALADALVSASYWEESFRLGRAEFPIEMAPGQDVFEFDVMSRSTPPGPAANKWVTKPLHGYPAVVGALAGAAETILKDAFGSGDITLNFQANHGTGGSGERALTVRDAARECAWSAMLDGLTTGEACVAGYDLGVRIAEYVLRASRR